MHFSIIPCSGSKARQMCPYFQIAPLNLPCHSHPGKWRSFGIGTPPEFCNDRVSFLHFIKTIITFPHLTLLTLTISTVNLSVKWTVSETRMWARLTHNGAHLRLNGDHNKMKNPKKKGDLCKDEWGMLSPLLLRAQGRYQSPSKRAFAWEAVAAIWRR